MNETLYEVDMSNTSGNWKMEAVGFFEISVHMNTL